MNKWQWHLTNPASNRWGVSTYKWGINIDLGRVWFHLGYDRWYGRDVNPLGAFCFIYALTGKSCKRCSDKLDEQIKGLR